MRHFLTSSCVVVQKNDYIDNAAAFEKYVYTFVMHNKIMNILIYGSYRWEKYQ